MPDIAGQMASNLSFNFTNAIKARLVLRWRFFWRIAIFLSRLSVISSPNKLGPNDGLQEQTMKAQSSFADRISRIENGTAVSAVNDVGVQPDARLINAAGKKRAYHFDMLVAGGLAGAVAGTLFAQNLGLLFVMSLDWITLYGLMLADYKLAAYIAACAVAPLGFLFSLIFSGTQQRALYFWACYTICVLGANHVEVRYVVEYIVIPGFWEFMGSYTSAQSAVTDAVATQPQF